MKNKSFCENYYFFIFFFWGGVGSGWWGIWVNVIEELKYLGKFTKKNRGGGGGQVRGLGWWGGGCVRRIEVFVKIQKKNIFFRGGGGGLGGRVGGGVRVDVNEELKFLGKFTKKKFGGGVGFVGGGGSGVDVNAMLGVRGDVGYGGCEPRIEGIVQCTKRYCTILRI